MSLIDSSRGPRRKEPAQEHLSSHQHPPYMASGTNINNASAESIAVPSLFDAPSSSSALSNSHERIDQLKHLQQTMASHALSPDQAAHTLSQAKRLFSERSLIRVLSPPQEDEETEHASSDPRLKQQANEHGQTAPTRVRVNSNPSRKPSGFPYCNSTRLINTSSLRLSGSSHNSSANSSDDVDLDMPWDSYSSQRHVGIDMGLFYVSGADQSKAPHDVPARMPRSGSRCRTVSNKNDNPDHSGSSSHEGLHTQHQHPQPSSHDKWRTSSTLALHERPDSPLAEGWKFNPTINPVPEAASDEGSNSGRESLRNKRIGSPIAPLRLWLDRGRREPANQTASPSVSADTPGTFSSMFDTSLSFSASTPATSQGPMTPRTPGSPKIPGAQVTLVENGVEEESQEGHIGTMAASELGKLEGGRKDGSFGNTGTTATGTFHSAQSQPMSLMGAVEQQHQSSDEDGDQALRGLGFQHVHFPDEEPTEQLANAAPPTATFHEINMDEPPSASVTALSPHTDDFRSPTPGSPLMSQPSSPNPQVGAPSLPAQNKSCWSLFSAISRARGSDTGSNSTQQRGAHDVSLFWSVRQWFEDAPPAATLFVLGFFAMPWFWFIGGWMLRSDGELPGTRGARCRCSPTSSSVHCPADIHRALRLMGVRPSGHGVQADVDNQLSLRGQNKLALLNVDTSYASGYILCNRIAAISSFLLALAGFIVAIYLVSYLFLFCVCVCAIRAKKAGLTRHWLAQVVVNF